jgi:hypothetical protein
MPASCGAAVRQPWVGQAVTGCWSRSDAGDPVRSVQATASTQTTATSVARAQPTRRLAGSTAACTAVISPSPRPHVLSAPRGSASTPPPPPTDRSRR